MSKTTYRKRIARAIFETLEDRRLMSASVSLSGGELLVQGDAATADHGIRVNLTASRDSVRVAVAGSKAQTFDRDAVGSIRMIGTEGDDVLNLARTVNVPAYVNGLGGDDRIAGGAAGDTLDGAAGDDRITGNDGDDTLAGGAGDDRLAGNDGNDTLDGGADGDRLDGGRGENAVVGVEQNDSGKDAARVRRENRRRTGEDSVAPVAPEPAPPPQPEPAPEPVPAPEPHPEPAPEPAPVPADRNKAAFPVIPSAPAPVAAITFTTDKNGMAGHSVHVHALASKLNVGDPLSARYEWDFGDAGARFKKLTGWNAAHTYDYAGTYTVTLTVTNAGGKVAKATATVTVAADTRRVIYVDAAKGSDANNGSRPDKAFRTLEKAAGALSDNTKLLVKNGQTHDVKGTARIAKRNVTLGTYGTGAKARVRKVSGGSGTSIIGIEGTARNVVVENIEFDSVWGFSSSYGTRKVPARGFYVAGNNITLRNNVFRNLTDGVSTEGKPTGLLVQDNLFTNEIRGYGIWSEGTDHVYLANTMRDSKQEHLIRAHGDGNGTVRLLISHNDLSRSSQSKGSIELRHAKWFYVASNRMTGGTLRAGLPTERFQLDKPTWKTEMTHWGVMEDNVTQRLFINLRAGVQHIAVRNNVIRVDDWTPVLDSNAILVETIAPGFDQVRKTDDVRVEYNTVINNDDHGNFMRVSGHATNLVVAHNLYVAPRINGGHLEGGLIVNDPGRGLTAFRSITGNVWPQTSSALNYVADAGYVSAAKWESYAQVVGDAYKDVSVGAGNYDVSVGSLLAGSSVTTV